MRPTPLLIALAVALVSPFTASAQQQWSKVKGQIVYDGVPPAPKAINAPAAALCPAMLNDNNLEVDPKSKGIRYVIISLAPVAGGNLPIHPDFKDAPKEAVVIDQPKCLFEPRVVALRQGQDLVVKNSAKVGHNVNYAGKNAEGNDLAANVLIPTDGQHVIVKPGASRYPLTIACNIHGWMTGKAAVFTHPYFAVTDKDGKFEIPNAPVGNYRLLVWHEEFGWHGGKAGAQGQEIAIPANKDFETVLKFKKAE